MLTTVDTPLPLARRLSTAKLDVTVMLALHNYYDNYEFALWKKTSHIRGKAVWMKDPEAIAVVEKEDAPWAISYIDPRFALFPRDPV
jgi:hypothetical protein